MILGGVVHVLSASIESVLTVSFLVSNNLLMAMALDLHKFQWRWYEAKARASQLRQMG